MVICDIDGCILENLHRRHLVPADRTVTRNWTTFNKACVDDKPIMPVINFVKHLAEANQGAIVFVTSRGENVRRQTSTQIQNHFSGLSCRLIMRNMEDDRNTVDYKKDVLEQLSTDFNESSILIDDHPGIIEMAKTHFPQLNRMLVPSYDCTVLNAA